MLRLDRRPHRRFYRRHHCQVLINATVGLVDSIVVAFIGALILTWIVRAISGSRSPV